MSFVDVATYIVAKCKGEQPNFELNKDDWDIIRRAVSGTICKYPMADYDTPEKKAERERRRAIPRDEIFNDKKATDDFLDAVLNTRDHNLRACTSIKGTLTIDNLDTVRGFHCPRCGEELINESVQVIRECCYEEILKGNLEDHYYTHCQNCGQALVFPMMAEPVKPED